MIDSESDAQFMIPNRHLKCLRRQRLLADFNRQFLHAPRRRKRKIIIFKNAFGISIIRLILDAPNLRSVKVTGTPTILAPLALAKKAISKKKKLLFSRE